MEIYRILRQKRKCYWIGIKMICKKNENSVCSDVSTHYAPGTSYTLLMVSY